MPKLKFETNKDRSLNSDSMWSSENRFSTIVIPILIVIIIALIVGLGWFALQDKNSKQELNSVQTELGNSQKNMQANLDDMQQKVDALQKTIDDKNTAAQKAAAENEKGFIEGSLSYPSNYIPKDMGVCALNLDTQKEYCDTDQLYDKKYTYGVGYKIQVPAGNYNVYATAAEQKDYKAYYDEFVTCGLKSNCPSHDPLEVKVTKDQTTSSIDPIDWYVK